MRNEFVIPLLLALVVTVRAEEFVPERVVFPITDFKPDIKHLAPVSIKFGTGFCLDQDCRFVGTNYHVAGVMGKTVCIKGVFSAQRYLDSAPDDVGAQDIKLALMGGSLKYTLAHDLAIYEMRQPLKDFHGIGFDAGELENNLEVDIYAYPFSGNPKRGLVNWHGKFAGKTPQGLLAFSYEEGRVRGGASGGIVVDSRTKKIVGILSAIGEGEARIALAVPVGQLANFVSRAQPYLQATLFPKTVFISPVATDLYPPYVWSRDEGVSETTRGETTAIAKLRFGAQRLADSMRNFVATQTFAWGHDNREPDATDAYETLIADGWQRWRRAGGKRFYDEIPFPPLSDWVTPGNEWSLLPQMVGTELSLKMRQAPDAIFGGRMVHVFQYAAKAEDEICSFRHVNLLAYAGLHRSKSDRFYDCNGEVWVDESGTIVRISLEIALTGPSYHYRAIVTYGWLEKDGVRYLVPVTIAAQVEQKKTYWCRGLFTDYEMFGVKARIVAPAEAERIAKSGAGAQ